MGVDACLTYPKTTDAASSALIAGRKLELQAVVPWPAKTDLHDETSACGKLKSRTLRLIPDPIAQV